MIFCNKTNTILTNKNTGLNQFKNRIKLGGLKSPYKGGFYNPSKKHKLV